MYDFVMSDFFAPGGRNTIKHRLIAFVGVFHQQTESCWFVDRSTDFF
jgi:hypothetical protein